MICGARFLSNLTENGEKIKKLYTFFVGLDSDKREKVRYNIIKRRSVRGGRIFPQKASTAKPMMTEQLIPMGEADAAALFGNLDENTKRIEKEYRVSILMRGDALKITGDPDDVAKAAQVVRSLMEQLARGEPITEQAVRYRITMVNEDALEKLGTMAADCVCITAKGKPVKAKTVGQQTYLDAIRGHTITIGIGPAGTGKTYLAVAAAVVAFRAHEVSRIILTRPAVEAGEKLGFLPGDLQQKVDPYLRPLYDALYDMLGAETYQRYLERGNIEVAPLAYMRGRTLDDSFIILDEAQNTSGEQMKMFLTRLGFGSRMVITGDATQMDLPDGKRSGLLEAQRVLRDVPDIAVIQLSGRDVVRHRLVQDIIHAYEKYEQKLKQH